MTTKVAVIGSGIAGLTAAHLLNRDSSFAVTLYEASPKLGMDSQRLDVPMPGGENASVDVPSRMFNGTQWPSLARLYDQIGVRSCGVDASQSFATKSDPSCYLTLPTVMNPVAALRQVLRKKPRQIIREAKRLLESASNELDSDLAGMTLAEYLNSRNFDDEFRLQFLYPTLSSTVCTCSYKSLDRYPAEIILNAILNISRGETLLRSKDGTADVVQRLCKDLPVVRLNCPVDSVQMLDTEVNLRVSGQCKSFDHVIVATQANTAADLIDSDRPELENMQRILHRIAYEDIHVFVHRDQSLMPADRTNWATFNMIAGEKSAACTVWLNQFYDDGRYSCDLFQTIDAGLSLNANEVLSEANLQRPTVALETPQMLQEMDSYHSGSNQRLWFCGSWAAAGIPLLETGVQSAQAIVNRIRESVSVTT